MLFRSDDLDYQMQAIHSTVELFRGLSRHVDGIYRPNRVRKFGEGDPVRNSDVVVGNIISYEVINGYELDESNIFELDTISAEDFEQEWRVFQARSDRSSAMNEYYKMDSEGEAEFAHKLENNTNVLLFTKLKKGGFVIDTPYGNYSPDWAVVCKKEALEDASLGIYFIVETKAGKREANLQDVERNKIHCGKLHFKAVSDQIKFDWVNSYEDFRTKFGVSEGN